MLPQTEISYSKFNYQAPTDFPTKQQASFLTCKFRRISLKIQGIVINDYIKVEIDTSEKKWRNDQIPTIEDKP